MVNQKQVENFGERLFKRDPSSTFKAIWSRFLPKDAIRNEDYGNVTAPLQKLVELEDSQKNKGDFLESATTKLCGTTVGQGNGVCGATPLAYDPEIVSIYNDEAPGLQEIPQEGYDGFVIQVNRIDNIQNPMGFTSEAEAQDLSENEGSGFTLSNSQFDMKIYADTLEVNDFSQRAASHYMDLRDTALGDRVAAHARYKERAVLYGAPGCGATDGTLFDGNCFSGVRGYCSDVGNSIDKSTADISTTNALLEDIKSEIKDLFQSQYNVNIGDYRIITSHDMKDALENQLSPGTRIDVNTSQADFGIDTVRIGGIPITATHNVRQLEDTGTTYSTGDPGDVFIVNTRDIRYRMLAPFTTIPLGRLGLADRMGLFEYGTTVARANGNFSKYLSAYDI